MKTKEELEQRIIDLNFDILQMENKLEHLYDVESRAQRDYVSAKREFDKVQCKLDDAIQEVKILSGVLEVENTD